MAVLARAPVDDLEAAWRSLAGQPAYRLLRGPDVGLVMVQARAGGTGDRFNLGEMTVTRCTVETAGGIVGHAYVAGRHRRHAELAALIDALLQDPARCDDVQEAVVVPLARAQEARRQTAAARAAATRVEFLTMVRGEE